MTAAMGAELEKHGVKKFEKFFRYVCTLEHIIKITNEDQQLCLIADLAPTVFNSLKYAIYKVIWQDFASCREKWFSPVDGRMKAGPLQEFSICKREFELEDHFKLKFEVGGFCTAKLNEASVFQSFYTNEEIYKETGREACIALDVALAMSGSEAVVESFYSVMNSQKKAGGQLNDTLVQRTNIDWCFPFPIQCRETIKEVATLYLKGDKDAGLKRHQLPLFVDQRGRALSKYWQGSRVIDRLSTKGCNFVLCEKDK